MIIAGIIILCGNRFFEGGLLLTWDTFFVLGRKIICCRGFPVLIGNTFTALLAVFPFSGELLVFTLFFFFPVFLFPDTDIAAGG